MDSEQDIYRKRLIKSKSGLRIVLVNEKYNSPFLLGEPNWVPDNEITHCTECKKKFKFTTRKHHCRRCGRIYCCSCCHARKSLPRMSFVDPVRLCSNCAETTDAEEEFFEKKLKTLISGATVLLSALNRNEDTNLCLCKLSPDHQFIQFDSLSELPPLPLNSVTNFNMAHDLESDGFEDDFTGVSCLEIQSENGGLRFMSGTDANKHIATEWLDALNQAFKLIEIA